MPPFDAGLLLEEYGDEGLVHDLAQLVIETMPAQITAVETAVEARDSAALRAAAHKLRGSITPFRYQVRSRPRGSWRKWGQPAISTGQMR